MRAMRLAEAAAERAGFDPADLKRAITFLQADPEQMLAEHERLGAVLFALRAPGVEIETPQVLDRTADETPERRAERLRRTGYLAAVLDDPGDRGGFQGNDARLWSEGWNAFRDDLAAHGTKDAAVAA